jgi:hypothetical protein
MFELRLLSAASIVLALSCTVSFSGAHGAKILAVTAMASPSHGIWNRIFLEALVDRGHEITALTAFPGKNRTGLKLVNKKIYFNRN